MKFGSFPKLGIRPSWMLFSPKTECFLLSRPHETMSNQIGPKMINFVASHPEKKGGPNRIKVRFFNYIFFLKEIKGRCHHARREFWQLEEALILFSKSACFHPTLVQNDRKQKRLKTIMSFVNPPPLVINVLACSKK